MRYSSDDGSDSPAASPRGGCGGQQLKPAPPKPPDAKEQELARLARAGLVPGGHPEMGMRRPGIVLLVYDYGFEVSHLQRARRLLASLARPPFRAQTHEVKLGACAEEDARYSVQLVPAFFVCATDGRLFKFQGEPEVQSLFAAWKATLPAAATPPQLPPSRPRACGMP